MGGEHWLFGYTQKRRQNLGKSWRSFGREMVQIIRPNAAAEPIQSVSQQGNVSYQKVPKKLLLSSPSCRFWRINPVLKSTKPKSELNVVWCSFGLNNIWVSFIDPKSLTKAMVVSKSAYFCCKYLIFWVQKHTKYIHTEKNAAYCRNGPKIGHLASSTNASNNGVEGVRVLADARIG